MIAIAGTGGVALPIGLAATYAISESVGSTTSSKLELPEAIEKEKINQEDEIIEEDGTVHLKLLPEFPCRAKKEEWYLNSLAIAHTYGEKETTTTQFYSILRLISVLGKNDENEAKLSEIYKRLKNNKAFFNKSLSSLEKQSESKGVKTVITDSVTALANTPGKIYSLWKNWGKLDFEKGNTDSASKESETPAKKEDLSKAESSD